MAASLGAVAVMIRCGERAGRQGHGRAIGMCRDAAVFQQQFQEQSRCCVEPLPPMDNAERANEPALK